MLRLTWYTWLFVVLVNGNERKLTNEEVLQQFEDIINEEKYVLALFTKSCCQCVECVETEALLASTSHHLEDSYGVKIVKLIEHKVLQERYGIKSYPTVLYIRDGIPLLYDGSLELDALLEAIEKNREPLIKSLNDESFEHLTQAATGATTGDWLVLFYNDACKKKKEMYQVQMETVGVRFQNRVNVAFVDTKESPELKERFKVTACPVIIYFRHSKMYAYNFPEITVPYLEKFLEGWYKNSKMESVPLPKTPFDKLTDFAAEFLQKHSKQILMYAALVIIIVFMLKFFLSFFSKKEKKE
ncbi:uncharacterized protein LOC111627549 [Centruroides sculpturatus]|uniref:uncharacterized protein LOC111627549 n=1 Tax=Centruroides sculpturatus TaxID=218467 RepID=UPI000C6D9AE4|nr:uncharacterized protein LOC111627549 [Centruroides sculpturatus]